MIWQKFQQKKEEERKRTRMRRRRSRRRRRGRKQNLKLKLPVVPFRGPLMPLEVLSRRALHVRFPTLLQSTR